MLSASNHHHHHHHGNHSTASGGSGNNTTPSQLRRSVAGLWSSGLFGSSGSLPNHGIPVVSTYEKLLEKHHNTLMQLKLSAPDLQETIHRGFLRFQAKMRDSRAQTNASLQAIGIPYILHELHETVRYDVAQAKVIQKQLEFSTAVGVTSPDDRKFRIARELAEARIKARQALQLNNSHSRDEESTTSYGDHEDDDSETVEKHDQPQHQQLPAPHSPNLNNSPTSVVGVDDSIGSASASSLFVQLTPLQKRALLTVVNNEQEEDDDEDIQEVAES